MTNLRPLQVGVIGCGFFSKNHLNAWRAIEGVNIAAVCDLDTQRAKQMATDYGVGEYYHDAEEMFSSEVLDFVDIVSRENTHRSLVEMAARHKTPVICQKPLADNMGDAIATVEACKAANVPFMVHENFRWQAPMRAVKQILNEGRIGEPFFGRFSFRSSQDVYANQPYLANVPRFIILDLGIHILDLSRFLLGDAESLTCHTSSVNPKVSGEDVATMLLCHQSGATSVVDVSYATHIHPDPFPQTLIHLEGPKGTIDLDIGYKIRITEGDQVETLHATPEPLEWLTPPAQANQESVLRIQRHWVDCLRNGCEPETSGSDNLKTLELVFAAYQSNDQNRSVTIKR